MFARSNILLLICILCSQYAFSQELNELNFDQLFEQLLEELNEDVDASEISERWTYFLKHPIHLNQTDGRELAELLFLSPIQIEQLIAHRTISGDFISLQELQSINGFDLRTIQFLLPFVTLGRTAADQKFNVQQLFENAEQELMFRYGRTLNKAQGYRITDSTRSRYLGDPNRYLLRYRFTDNHKIRLAINMDKDAGEPFFRDKQKSGFDFYSMSLSIRNVGIFKHIVLGDYALQFGQGLTMWNGLSFGKGSIVQQAARQGIGLKSYTSFNEINFLRGIATALQVGKIEWTPYVSYRNIDGRVDIVDDERILTTLAISGLHRTPTEQRYRKAIGQLVYGSNLMYQDQGLKIGVNYHATHLDAWKLPADAEENKYDFKGNLLQNLSLYANYNFHNSYVFAEAASSLDQGYAWLTGIISSIHPKFSTVVLYRDYQPDFHSFFAQGIGETSGTHNEKGLYTGIVYHPSRQIQWTTYLDIFKFPWLRYRTVAPSQGYDLLSQFNYIWYKKGQLSIRFRYRLREENADPEWSDGSILAAVKRYQLRFEFKYKINNYWNIRTRMEGIQYQKEFEQAEYGWMLYQDVFWNSYRQKIGTNIRLAYFRTDSYNTRIYAYENDVLYASSFPVYYQEGWRTYINLKFNVHRNIDFWTKYSVFYYPKQTHISSGLDEITGPVRSDLRLQLRMQF